VEKTILVTGARGFIGFNAIQRWIKQDPSLNVIAIDANTYAD
jgi:dTDP-D-glucose 4,6-dehydratase